MKLIINNDENAFEADNVSEPLEWQKALIDDRLNDYYQNSIDMMDFDKTLDDIEKSL